MAGVNTCAFFFNSGLWGTTRATYDVVLAHLLLRQLDKHDRRARKGVLDETEKAHDEEDGREAYRERALLFPQVGRDIAKCELQRREPVHDDGEDHRPRRSLLFPCVLPLRPARPSARSVERPIAVLVAGPQLQIVRVKLLVEAVPSAVALERWLRGRQRRLDPHLLQLHLVIRRAFTAQVRKYSVV